MGLTFVNGGKIKLSSSRMRTGVHCSSDESPLNRLL
jgi:hypothetical protein